MRPGRRSKIRGLVAGSAGRDEIELVLGSCNGSLASIAAMTRDTYVQDPPYHVSAMEFPNTVMNSPAGNCAIWHNLKGLNTTVSGGYLWGLSALQYAVEKIQLDYAKLLLVGAVEEHGDYSAAWLARARSLRGSRPMPLAEGGIFFLVEAAETARQAGRQVFAEILGCATGFDPMLTAPEKSAALTELVVGLLDNAKLDPAAIAAVATTNLGYPITDDYEAAVLHSVFGNARPAVVAPTDRLGDVVSALNLFQVMAGLAAVADTPGDAIILLIATEPSGRIGAALFKRPANKANIQ